MELLTPFVGCCLAKINHDDAVINKYINEVYPRHMK